MKRKVKFLLVVLVISIISSCFVACSKNEIPDGYQLIAREGDTFRLYVPTQGWMPNVSGGTTSAYYSVSSEATGMPAASVSVYTPDDAAGCASADAYWEIAEQKLKAELDGYTYIEDESGATVLGGETAKKCVFTAQMNTGVDNSGATMPVKYKFMQLIAEHNGKIYILQFSAPEAEYAARVEVMNGNAENDDLGIIGYFKFSEAYVGGDGKKYDKVDRINGMKLASSKERPYVFYTVETWKVDESASITTVYAEDKSNVTVQYIMPDEKEHSVEKYWQTSLQTYKNVLSELVEGQPEEKTISGIEGGLVGTFSGKRGGVEYKFKQAIVLKGEVYYVITYTATAENYEAHLSDVDKMIEHFSIK